MSASLLLALIAAKTFAPLPTTAQGGVAPWGAPRPQDAATTALALHKLGVVGSVLYVAAHPDDENTRLIAWLANERQVRTGYLSLTRGDGGQNLIGPELREKLGLIRTQELLAARRLDGGEQFFTRANDFGFSKTPVEALRIWDRDQVLADVVRTIRRFRPDVIITRFSPEPMNTHGHHTASAQLAVEAFSAAADPKRFPEQLVGSEKLEVWQAKRIFWNTSAFFFENKADIDKGGFLTLDVGGYNPLLGKSYGEIAALSRSQHRSQGFGSAGTRGEALEYFKLLAGDPLPPEASKPGQADLLVGVDLTWGRVPGAEKVGKLLAEVVKQFDPARPDLSVDDLMKVKTMLMTSNYDRKSHRNRPYDDWRSRKHEEINAAAARCAGVFVQATTDNWALEPSQFVTVKLEIVRRTALPLAVLHLKVPELAFDSSFENGLLLNKPLIVKIRRPAKLEFSQPYWLRQEPLVGMYRVTDPKQIGAPGNAPAITVTARFSPVAVTTPPLGSGRQTFLDDVPVFTVTVPVLHRRVDPADGEIYRPLAVVPPVAVSWPDAVALFADAAPRPLVLSVKAGAQAARGIVRLEVPAGWRAEPAEIPFELAAPGAEQRLEIRLTPPADGSAERLASARLHAIATLADGRVSANGQQVIHYPHIPEQVLFPEATVRLVRADVRRGAITRVGYVVGAGDDVPAALRQMGYLVTLLGEGDLTPSLLKTFDAIVLGIRAYNTLPWLGARQPALVEYARQGGTVVVQYNTDQPLLTAEIGPYPLTLSRDRVTDEGAAVELIAAADPLLTTPNRITTADFQGWVQEQGLYYPGKWDAHYTPLLASHDPGEAPLKGALLVARVGAGTWIYTGLSFFRELPAGVPGAMRLFANLLAGGK